MSLPLPLKAAVNAAPLLGPLPPAGLRSGEARRRRRRRQRRDGAVGGCQAYLYRQPTNEQQLSVASGWLQQALAAASSGLAGWGVCTPEEQEMLENAEKVMREIIENPDLDLLDHSGAYIRTSILTQHVRVLYSSWPSCL